MTLSRKGNTKIDISLYKVKHTFLFIAFYISTPASAQVGHQVYSAYQMAKGYQQSFGKGAHVITSNPALLPLSSDKWIVMASSEKRYFTDINGHLGGIAKQINSNSGIALMISDYGISEWKESSAKISYGRKLTKNISLGSSFTYDQLRLKEYGSRSQWNFDLGLTYTSDEDYTISLMFQNLSTQGKDELRERIFVLGGQYKLSELVRMSTELTISSWYGQRISWSYALQYQIFQNVMIIVGVHANASAPSLGVVLNISDSIEMTVSSSRHRYLGSSAGLSLAYSFR